MLIEVHEYNAQMQKLHACLPNDGPRRDQLVRSLFMLNMAEQIANGGLEPEEMEDYVVRFLKDFRHGVNHYLDAILEDLK